MRNLGPGAVLTMETSRDTRMRPEARRMKPPAGIFCERARLKKRCKKAVVDIYINLMISLPHNRQRTKDVRDLLKKMGLG